MLNGIQYTSDTMKFQHQQGSMKSNQPGINRDVRGHQNLKTIVTRASFHSRTIVTRVINQ